MLPKFCGSHALGTCPWVRDLPGTVPRLAHPTATHTGKRRHGPPGGLATVGILVATVATVATCLVFAARQGGGGHGGAVVSPAGCSWRCPRDLKFIQGKFLRGRKKTIFAESWGSPYGSAVAPYLLPGWIYPDSASQ